jgi:hypothetical protein
VLCCAVWLQTWLLFVLLSVVSMAMGFYDLWKNVPYFKQFVVRMFRPAAAVFEWLEGHTQVRKAVLLFLCGSSVIWLLDSVTHLSAVGVVASQHLHPSLCTSNSQATSAFQSRLHDMDLRWPLRSSPAACSHVPSLRHN